MKPGLVPGGFEPHPHARHETSDAATHVESLEDVRSDAGSTPAASTTPLASLGHGAKRRREQVSGVPEGNGQRHFSQMASINKRPTTSITAQVTP